jgi:hypothetical protein
MLAKSASSLLTSSGKKTQDLQKWAASFQLPHTPVLDSGLTHLNLTDRKLAIVWEVHPGQIVTIKYDRGILLSAYLVATATAESKG